MFTLKQELGLKYNVMNLQVGLVNMWEMKAGQFMMICVTNKEEHNAVSEELGVIQNNYVWDTTNSTIQ
jgi:hypothetical protein